MLLYDITIKNVLDDFFKTIKTKVYYHDSKGIQHFEFTTRIYPLFDEMKHCNNVTLFYNKTTGIIEGGQFSGHDYINGLYCKLFTMDEENRFTITSK